MERLTLVTDDLPRSKYLIGLTPAFKDLGRPASVRIKFCNLRLDDYFAHLFLLTQPASHHERLDMRQVTFVDIRLSSEEKIDFQNWAKTEGQNWPSIAEHFVEAGFKFSMSYDAKNSTYIASVTCWAEGDPNYGMCFSSRAGDLWAAFSMMLFKIDVVLMGVVWAEAAQTSNWG